MRGAVLMKREGNTLVPADADASAALSRVKDGEPVAVKLCRGRSLRQHCMFWAHLTAVAEATEWETPERLLVALKVALGYYDVVKLPNGRAVPAPHSISFAEMTQDEFQRFMDQSMDLIDRDILGGRALSGDQKEAA